MRLKRIYLDNKFLFLFKAILLISICLIGNTYCKGNSADINAYSVDDIKKKVQDVISPFSEDLEIEKVEYNESDNNWHIEGYAKNMETIFRYLIPSLEISDYFRNAMPIEASFELDDIKAYFLVSVELREPFEIIPSGSGKIRGRVIERSKPIAGVKVRLIMDGNQYTQYAVTDENGIFIISIEPGEYYIVGEEVKPILYNKTISGLKKAYLGGPGTKQKIIVEEDKIVDIKYPISI